MKAYDFGWVDVTMLTHTGDYSLRPSREKDGVFRVDTGSEGDFYLWRAVFVTGSYGIAR